jgi:hypothetical protein
MFREFALVGSRFIGSIDMGKREREFSSISVARRNRSDGTNGAIGEYFSEEVLRRILIRNLNLK